MNSLLKLSELIERLVLKVADISAWAFILMMITIVFDVISRKFGFQIPGLGSTRLQELEWHYHIILFSLWLGANYVRNQHVRVDVAVISMADNKRAWIEFIGLLLFALPFVSLAVFFGFDFALNSLSQMEGSSAPTGLPHRWLIKFVLAFGLLLLWLAVLAKIFRCIVYLFGDSKVNELANPLAKIEEQGAATSSSQGAGV